MFDLREKSGLGILMCVQGRKESLMFKSVNNADFILNIAQEGY